MSVPRIGVALAAPRPEWKEHASTLRNRYPSESYLGPERAGVAPMEPIIFLHCPKAGGTALHEYFMTCFAADVVHPVFHDSPHDRRGLDSAELERYDYLCGHFGHRVVAKLVRRYSIVTNFRHPVSRILSLYDFWRNTITEEAAIAAGEINGPRYAKSMTFSEFIRHPSPYLSLYLDNAHSRQLLSDNWTPSVPGIVDRWRLRKRILSLRYFYIAEYPELSSVFFELRFGIAPTFRRVNESLGAKGGRGVSAADAAHIVGRNRTDLSIYLFARNLMARAIGA